MEARSLGGQQQSFWDPEANLISVLRFLNDCNCTYSSLVYGQEFGGEGSGTPLQYPLLENPMDGGARWAAVHGVAESDTIERLHFHFHALEKEMASHSSVLAWRIPGTGKPGGLPSTGSHRVGHD